MLGRAKRTRLSGLSASLLAGEAAEFLHLPPGPGQQLAKALKHFDVDKNGELIGFHGQTIYHNPKNNIPRGLKLPFS